MKLSSFLAVSGAIGILFGLEFLLVPGFALPQYGMPTEPHNLLQARYFGASLLPWSLIAWLSVAIYGVFLVGALWFLSSPARRA
jgi:hypothetical protein